MHAQLQVATPQKPHGPNPWTSMSAMAIEKPWIAELEKQKVKADSMNWDLAMEKYCAIESTIKAKQDAISSAKLEWLT